MNPSDHRGSLTPRETVAELDRYVIGQAEAKRSVAIALRNRWRRQQVEPPLREEIAPKNIIMIGPTGVGKTEIARRLAHLAQSPFLKIEASKFTEVGYVGRDVESMIRDLVQLAITMVTREEAEGVQGRAAANAEERLLDLLLPRSPAQTTTPAKPAAIELGYDGAARQADYQGQTTRERFREMLRRGELDDRTVELAVSAQTGAPEVSREGVQRDLLPIVEGTTVTTKYGPVKTDHILFIASGAFHVCKPSDLVPELQGRFPIRVNLHALGEEEFFRILTEPQNALIRQYTALLATEDVRLVFEDEAIREMARIAVQVNEKTEDIGARRLHTVIERVLDEVSFDATDREDLEFRVTADYVRRQLTDISENEDLSRYIL